MIAMATKPDTVPTGAERAEREWDEHWQSEDKKGLRETIAGFFREHVFAPTVDHFVNHYFPATGAFVEAGCGSGAASSQIAKKRRRLFALDISSAALKRARGVGVYDQVMQADILRLPFRDASVGGVWNLGVMEHFHEPELLAILREFDRILVPGGRVLLFWPADYTSSQLVMRVLEFFIRFRKRGFQFYPDEVSRIHSSAHVKAIIARSPLRLLAHRYSWRNVFADAIVVLETVKRT
jgi:SAM-dependent methyltransferase